jgi:hypothetical protein
MFVFSAWQARSTKEDGIGPYQTRREEKERAREGEKERRREGEKERRREGEKERRREGEKEREAGEKKGENPGGNKIITPLFLNSIRIPNRRNEW